jgi:hypothetical protein
MRTFSTWIGAKISTHALFSFLSTRRAFGGVLPSGAWPYRPMLSSGWFAAIPLGSQITQVHPGITMNLVPVTAHPKERAREASLYQTKESAQNIGQSNGRRDANASASAGTKDPLPSLEATGIAPH